MSSLLEPQPPMHEPGGDPDDPEAGLATAELLGNAALGIAALIAIWAMLQALGLDIVEWIRSQLLT